MRMRSFGSVIGCLTLAAVLAACGPKAGDVKPGGPTLYDKLGGREALAAVVSDFADSVKADERIKAKFSATSDWEGLKNKLTEQLCAAAGGPCTYAGKDMKSAHQGMGLTDADYAAFVDDLKKTLEKFKVGEKEQAELLATLTPMKKDIIASPTP